MRAVVRVEWQKAPPCWLMMCCPMSQRVAGFLEREGLLVRDDDNDYLALDGDHSYDL